LTDRDILVDEIERMCVIDGKECVETEHAIEIVGVAKFLWTDDGQIKSIIRDGKSYGPEGVRRK